MRKERNPLSSYPQCERIHYDDGEAYVLYAAEPSSDLQATFGASTDPRGRLVVGRVYELERVDQHSMHSKYILRGVESGRGFNSVLFTLVGGDTPTGVLA